VPQNLLDLFLVKPKVGGWLSCGSRIWARGSSQRHPIMNGLRHLHGIAVAGNVYVHHVRRFPEEMIVHSGFVDSILLELHHYGCDLVLGENQVTHDHRSAAVSLEGHPRT
jgi:hypothetical protein